MAEDEFQMLQGPLLAVSASRSWTQQAFLPPKPNVSANAAAEAVPVGSHSLPRRRRPYPPEGDAYKPQPVLAPPQRDAAPSAPAPPPAVHANSELVEQLRGENSRLNRVIQVKRR